MSDNFRRDQEFEEKVIQVKRVSKKTKGGNKISFTALVVIGNRKGKIGLSLGKAPDVLSAIQKAIRQAKTKLFMVPMENGTIPHDIQIKRGAAKILIRRAPEGTGLIAGGPVRDVVEKAGIRNVVAKILGTSNKASNVYATIDALKQLKTRKKGNKK